MLTKPVNFSKLPSQLPSRPSKEVLAKSKFYRKNTPSNNRKTVETTKLFYAQILSRNINNILKIKENFPELLNKKIEELNKLIYNNLDKYKPRINMTIKGPSYKQIIVLMSNSNTNKFMTTSSKHVANLNWSLRSIKSNFTIDFIHINHCGLIVTSNKVISQLDISMISKYVKNCDNVDSSNIQEVQLLQSKLYLKILGISYIMKGINVSINSEVIETIIKSTHIFDNINIVSKLCVIKVFLKYGIVII